MFQNLKNLMAVVRPTFKSFKVQSSFLNETLLRTVRCGFFDANVEKNFHTNHLHMKDYAGIEKRKAVQSTRKIGEIEGENSFEADYSIARRHDLFPTPDLPNREFDGIQFKDLPVVYIKATRNNTIVSLCDKGVVKVLRSGGTEGFKNTRKGTDIAAQTAGVSLGMRALKKGIKTVRVFLKGLGPGRLGAVKGVQSAGINVVSVSDRTPDFHGRRPKKQRRI